MKQLTPQQKHSILTHYTSPDNTQTLDQILSLHGVSVTRQAVEYWMKRWNGSAASLEGQEVSGRPRVLSRAQVSRHVAAPIRNANRAARNIHYSKLQSQVQAATGTSISQQTLRRYGKEELSGRRTRGTKRTIEESECTHTSNTFEFSRSVEYHAHESVG